MKLLSTKLVETSSKLVVMKNTREKIKKLELKEVTDGFSYKDQIYPTQAEMFDKINEIIDRLEEEE